MKCDEFEEQVHHLLDRRENPWSSEHLQEHAQACSACQTLLSTCEAMSDGLTFFEIEDLDAGFSRAVVGEVTTARCAPRRHRIWAAAIAVLSTSALLLILPSILPWQSKTPGGDQGQLTTARSAPDVPAEAPETPAGLASKRESSPQTADDIYQVSALLAEWKSRLSAEPWEPVDRLEGGLEPITTTLSIAIDELRATIPLGRTAQPEEDPRDSAGTWPIAHLSHTA